MDTFKQVESQLPEPKDYPENYIKDICIYDYENSIPPYIPDKVCYSFQTREIGITSKLKWDYIGINFKETKSDYENYEGEIREFLIKCKLRKSNFINKG